MQRHREKNGASKKSGRKARRFEDKDQPQAPDINDDEEPESLDTEAEGDIEDVLDDNRAPRRRARRHSKKAFNPCSDDPWQAAFYPETWQEVLRDLKIAIFLGQCMIYAH